MAKTRVGIVGCGGISEAHLPGLAKHPDVELVGFCDVDPARVAGSQAKYAPNAQTFSDAKALFTHVAMDAAYFFLPPFAHGPEIHAVENAIPFLVEKPVHNDVKRAEEIAAGIAEKGIITAAGYMNRYRKSVQRVKELSQDDPPIFSFGGWIGGSPKAPAGGGIGSWWVDKSKSGGQMHEQVTHTVDIVLWLCGVPVEVHAFAATGFNKGTPANYDIEDAMVLNCRFANDAVANIWSSCSSNGGGGGVTLNVYANNFTALFTGWEHSVRILTDGGKSTEEIKGEPNIFEIEDNTFIEAVRTNNPSLIKTPYADGVDSIRVTLGASESFVTGKPIALR